MVVNEVLATMDWVCVFREAVLITARHGQNSPSLNARCNGISTRSLWEQWRRPRKVDADALERGINQWSEKPFTNRVYVTGHSNGGGFTYLLWGERGDLLAAVAPVAAGGAVFLREAKPCPVLHIAGKNDEIVDFQNQERAVEAARKVNGTNAPVEFVVHNGGHAYPNDAPEKIVAFFKQHARK